jgi:hypothetical protein
MDILLIAQELEHGIMNPTSLIHYVATLFKTNCAPCRDAKVDEMIQTCEKGDVCGTLRHCFEIVELMKLVLND